MASPITVQNRVRVGGSGFTIFTFAGQPIAFCQQVSHTSPQPVGQGASAIQPMDEPYPVEIITPAAAGPGQLVLNLFELFGSGGVASRVWDRLGAPLGGTKDAPFPGNAKTGYNLTPHIDENAPGAIFAGLGDIVDIFIAQAKHKEQHVQIVKYIRPLAPGKAQNREAYFETYHGCKITNVADNEQIEVGTLDIVKQITVTYRYYTRKGQQPLAFALRNRPL